MPSTTDAKLYLGSTLISGGAPAPEPWVRPADWLALPTVGATEQKFVGLYAVTNDDSNILALLARGAYTVDWGDGSAPEDIADNTQASHVYDYSTISSETLSTRGYKQVIVTVTPQAGQTLTVADLNQRPTEYGSELRNHAWLDITVGSPSITSLVLYGTVCRINWCEQVTIVSHNMTSMQERFGEMSALQSVPLFDTSSATSMFAMFFGCVNLQSVPLFDTSSATDISNMFNNCRNLQSVPLFDTSSATNISNMFNGCRSLQSVPLFDTSSVTTMSQMFQNCFSLQSVPLFDTSSVTTMSQMFRDCPSLQSVPLFDTSSATNISNMFNGCRSLQSVPLFDTSSATSMFAMFLGCVSLASAPLQGTKLSISYLNCKLARAELVDIFNGLADLTGLTGQTITITGNWGAAELSAADLEIATDKNWTVTI